MNGESEFLSRMNRNQWFKDKKTVKLTHEQVKDLLIYAYREGMKEAPEPRKTPPISRSDFSEIFRDMFGKPKQ